MQEVKVRYRPVGWLPFERSLKGRFPGKWEEVTPRQLIALSSLSESDEFSKLLSLFSGLPPKVCRRMDAIQQSELWKLNGWMEHDLSFNRFLIPEVNAGGITLHAPRESLRGVTFGRFVFLDTAFIQYRQDGEEADLDRFIASLYIPQGAVFTDELPLENEPKVLQIPWKVKLAIAFNYTLVRQWLAGRYPLLFSLPPDRNDQGAAAPGDKKSDPRVWIRVYESIVGDDIVNHDRYGDIPLHNVLRYLTAHTKENMKR